MVILAQAMLAQAMFGRVLKFLSVTLAQAMLDMVRRFLWDLLLFLAQATLAQEISEGF